METVACNLCGSEDYRFVYRRPDARYFPAEWFDVVACRQCGLGFTNPRPTYEEMGRYYPEVFYDGFVAEEAYHRQRYAQEARFVENAIGGAKGRLLDVGCANGDFPRMMRERGWQIEGVEIADNARQIPDFKVYREEFSRIPVCEPTYDAVTAWAVLEHVHDPMAYFRKAAQVLKPGGAFVFLVTNFNSPTSNRLFQEDIPRHLYFFTESCVREYLQRTGFTLVSADYSDKVYAMHPVNWLLYQLGYRLRGRPFTWEEFQRLEADSRSHYLKSRGLTSSPTNLLRYALAHPVHIADRLLLPLYANYQKLTRAYGIVTYVARRTHAG